MPLVRATDPVAASRDPPPAMPFFLPPPPPPPPPLPSSLRLLRPPPIVLRLHPAFLAEMDSCRTTSLVKFLNDEGAIPSPEADRKREQVIRKLNKIVMDWAKVVAYEQRVPPRRATATVLIYGSYTLGAHGPESDIDALCVGPCIATLQYHFFVVLRQILEERPEVSELQTVETAKVPLMRFRFSGISVDFTYAQLPVINASEAINTSDPHLLQKLDSRSWRSLSGVRVNEQIVQLVPNAEKFQILLRCIKLWAKRRGIHCHLLGFFAGIHLAILAAYVCQRYPYGTINGLFIMFFDMFAHWPCQIPVSLHGQPTNCRHSDGSFMPIVMPCTPPEFCASNMTKGTFRKIREELMRGYALTKEIWRHDFEWVWLFTPFPYTTKYEEFLRIALCAPTSEELRDWAGWVKSRFRNLILKLESIGVECDPHSTEEVDHRVIEPNTVYHWGLIYKTSTHVDINSLGDDFMKDVITDVYGKVKCTHSKLTMSIVRSSQLPKSLHSHRVYTPYLPQYMLGYQTPTNYSGTAG
ncbi:nuclear poly(A) polymerase 3 [Oryza brachyantha]|uniref:polynucleotide adenylyltransferase n=1 Tax=Oryza brachyantha TaxID=4533 RepID=J3MPB8_ORYBR|nr:nuclear poly(A) polymerase 3 [Oryza brachyantha]